MALRVFSKSDSKTSSRGLLRSEKRSVISFPPTFDKKTNTAPLKKHGYYRLKICISNPLLHLHLNLFLLTYNQHHQAQNDDRPLGR